MEMENIILKLLEIDDILNILLIVFVSFLGSMSKDYLSVLNNPNTKFNIIEVILSMITASISVYSLSGFIIEFVGVKGLVLSSFIAGLVGFEVLNQVSTLKGVFRWVDIILKIIRHEYILKEDVAGINLASTDEGDKKDETEKDPPDG